jgi:hypothetical protein
MTFYLGTTRGFVLVDFFGLRGREAVSVALSWDRAMRVSSREGFDVGFLLELLIPLGSLEQLPVLEAGFQANTPLFYFSSFFLLSGSYSPLN